MKGFEELDIEKFYEKLLTIQQSISEVSNKIDIISVTAVDSSKCSDNMKEHEKKQSERFEKIEKELEPLKSFQYKVYGGMIVLNAIVLFVIKRWG
jgi:uncharacterized coiled-coil DUF342 family protein